MLTKEEEQMADDNVKLLSEGPSRKMPSIIGEDLTITGNVISKGDIQVDGEIQGDVQCGSLLLGDKSQIIGGAAAEDVLVQGRVFGSIRGLRVTLQAQSHVEADIFHASLEIEEGAYFEGKSRRTADPLSVNPTSTREEADKPASNLNPPSGSNGLLRFA
jgi:cytoskeletal protein CcmA (bactofilin family)